MTPIQLINNRGQFILEVSPFIADEAVADLETLRMLAEFLPNQPQAYLTFHKTIDGCIQALRKKKEKGERVAIHKYRRRMSGAIGSLKPSFANGSFGELLWATNKLFLNARILEKKAREHFGYPAPTQTENERY